MVRGSHPLRVLRPLLGPLSPLPATTVHWVRSCSPYRVSNCPFSPGPRRSGCCLCSPDAHRGVPVPALTLHLLKSSLVPGSPPRLSQSEPRRPPPSSRSDAPGRVIPIRWVGPRRPDKPTAAPRPLPASPDACSVPRRSSRLTLAPLPFPAYPCAPSGRFGEAKRIRTPHRPPSGLRT